MTETAWPSHVPADLVRDFDLGFRGPVDELFTRFDSLRGEGRVLWLRAGLGGDLGAAGGAWLLTREDDIHSALTHPDVFSSRLGGTPGGDGQGDAGGASLPAMIPIFLDPPDHTRYRRLLSPLFSSRVVAAMEDGIRSRLDELIDSVIGRGGCDFVTDVAIHFPTRVFTAWMGLPEEETATFTGLVSALMHGDDDPDARQAALGGAFVVLDQLITDRLASPGDDLMSDIVGLDIDGRPLTRDELFRIAFLLFLAGLDTVVAALSFSFWHLATAPEHRRAIADGTVPVARGVDELLRRHSFVNLPRVVAHDVEFAGVRMRKGDPVVVPTVMASRDPAAYDDAAAVQIERDAGRHFAFGLGAHHCLGAHLARLEMRVALEVWHARIPHYELAGPVTSYAGTVMGVRSLPLRWPAPVR